VVRAFSSQLGVGDAAQFSIHQRDQAVERLLFPARQFFQ